MGVHAYTPLPINMLTQELKTGFVLVGQKALCGPHEMAVLAAAMVCFTSLLLDAVLTPSH
jgi:hypothetical protein